jgi:hypothetical protein
MRKRDVKLKERVVCKAKVSMQYLLSDEGEGDPVHGAKYYFISCSGFSHNIAVRHKRKDACMRLWNLINNEGGQKGK